MRKILDGSKMARGRKKRRNIRKEVMRKPATLAHTMRRRILFTVGSGVLSRTGPTPFAPLDVTALLATGRDGVVAGILVGLPLGADSSWFTSLSTNEPPARSLRWNAINSVYCLRYTSTLLQRANYTIPRKAGITLCKVARLVNLNIKSADPLKYMIWFGGSIYTLFSD